MAIDKIKMRKRQRLNERITLKSVGFALGGIGVVSLAVPVAHAAPACTNPSTSQVVNGDLAVGQCINFSNTNNSTAAAWNITLPGNHEAKGDNDIVTDTGTGVNVGPGTAAKPVSVTFDGPTTIHVNGGANSPLRFLSTDKFSSTTINGVFTGIMDGGPSTSRVQGFALFGQGSLLNLNGALTLGAKESSNIFEDALIVVQNGAQFNAATGSSLTLDATGVSGFFIEDPTSAATISGTVNITTNGGAPANVNGNVVNAGVVVLGGNLTISADRDSSSSISGRDMGVLVDAAAFNTATATIKDTTISALAGSAVVILSGSTFNGSRLQIESSMGSGLEVFDFTSPGRPANASIDSSTIDNSGANVNGVWIHGAGAGGDGGATAQVSDTKIRVSGLNAAGGRFEGQAVGLIDKKSLVIADGENAVGVVTTGQAQVTVNDSTIRSDGTGSDAHGVWVQGGNLTVGTDGTMAQGGSLIESTRAGVNALQVGGGIATLDHTVVQTAGDGAVAVQLNGGATQLGNDVTVQTNGENANGVVFSAQENAGTLSFGTGTHIATTGLNSNGFTVSGANSSYAIDGTGLQLANISVQDGALVSASKGGTLTLSGAAAFGTPGGSAVAAAGVAPAAWGALAAQGGTIVFQDAVSTNGNGIKAAAGGTLVMSDTSSAAGSVVHLDAAAGAVAAGTLDAAGHDGALQVGYLEGAGTVEMGTNDLMIGGGQTAGSYTFSGTISGNGGSLFKQGTHTQVLSGSTAWGLQNVFLQGGVLVVDGITDPAAFPLTVHMDGGWLDLSDNPTNFDPGNPGSANNWGIHLVDDGNTQGGVIGANDNVTVNVDAGQPATDWNFQVGGDPAQNGQGVYLIKTGDGTARLTASNEYLGSTQIKGGVLQVSSDDNLGSTQVDREVRLMGGDLQIVAQQAGTADAFTSKRDVWLYANGGVIVDSGVSATLGDVLGEGGYVFTKGGDGSLVLGAATLTAGLMVSGGQLEIDGGAIANSGAGAAIQASSGTTVTVVNTEVTGTSDLYSVTTGGHGVFNASGSTLSGDIHATGTGTAVDVAFDKDTHYTGTATQGEGGTLNMSLSGAETKWNLDQNAILTNLSNTDEATISFAAPTDSSPGSSGYHTLTVEGDYEGGGNIGINTYLNTGGAATPIGTDTIAIKGNVSGVTTLIVNPLGNGANTNVREDNQFHGDEGISVVQVAGSANANSFQLPATHPYVTAPGGSVYQYRLFGYGPDSPYGTANPSSSVLGAGGEAGWDYRLQTAYETSDGKIIPGTKSADAPGDERPLVVPQTSSYLIAPLVVQRYDTMVMDNLRSQNANTRTMRPSDPTDVSMFANFIGETGGYRTNRNWQEYGSDFDQNSQAFQVGGNVVHYLNNNEDQVSVGIAGTFGWVSATPSTSAALSSKLSIQAQSVAFSGGWRTRNGWYANAIVSGSYYSGSVNGQTADVDSLHGYGVDVSVEGGKSFTLSNGLIVEPELQVLSQTAHFNDTTDSDGVRAVLGTSQAWTTSAGFRFSYPVSNGVTWWKPYASVGLSYTWLQGANPVLSGVAFNTGGVGGAMQMAAGMSGSVTKRLDINAELSGQVRLGGFGHSVIGGRANLTYHF